MAAQKGKELLLKRSPDAGATFVSIGGLRAKQIQLNGQLVDVTNSDSDGWAEHLNGAGVKQVSFSGGGVFVGDAASIAVAADWFADATTIYQVIVPGWGTLQGSFSLANMTFGGGHNDELQFTGQFQSTGEVAFTAA